MSSEILDVCFEFPHTKGRRAPVGSSVSPGAETVPTGALHLVCKDLESQHCHGLLLPRGDTSLLCQVARHSQISASVARVPTSSSL